MVNVRSGASVYPRSVDPAKAVWFSPITGAPLLAHVAGETNTPWEFYPITSAKFHPGTGKPLVPVTPADRSAWEADIEAKREAAAKAAAESKAAETAIRASQQAAEEQRLADTQRREEAVAENRRLELQSRDEERRRAEQAAEQQRLAEAQQQEQQRQAAAQQQEQERWAYAQQQAATENARLAAEAQRNAYQQAAVYSSGPFFAPTVQSWQSFQPPQPYRTVSQPARSYVVTSYRSVPCFPALSLNVRVGSPQVTMGRAVCVPFPQHTQSSRSACGNGRRR
jgi:hypothetical protein